MAYILGVDPSLTSTGIAWLDTDSGEWVTERVRTSKHDGTRADYWSRMRMIGGAVKARAFDGVPVDLVVIEGLATYGHNAGLLAALWWQIVGPLEADGVEVVAVAPATRAKYASGSGRASKSDVLAAVRATYPAADVPGHDIADACALAALGARLKGFPVEGVSRPWVQEVAASVVAREAEKNGK